MTVYETVINMIFSKMIVLCAFSQNKKLLKEQYSKISYIVLLVSYSLIVLQRLNSELQYIVGINP